MSPLDPFLKKPEIKPTKEIIEKPPFPKEPKPEKEAELGMEKEKPAKELKEKPKIELEEEIIILPPLPSLAVPLPKTPTLQQIESILEEDLGELYFNLTPQFKKEFKRKGEETASKIERLLQQVKVKAKDIFKLIIEWLKLVPGVNRFFLEQEAKIKTDKIMRLKKKS